MNVTPETSGFIEPRVPLLTRGRRSRLGRAVAATAGVNVVIASIGGIGGVLLARKLGPSDRGGLVVIMQWPAVLSTMVSLGITHSTCYWVARRRQDAPAIMGTATIGGVMSGLVVAVGGFMLAPYVGRTNGVDHSLRLVFLLSPVYIVAGIWASALQAASVTKWNVVRSIQPATYFVAVVALMLFDELTLVHAAQAFALSVLTSGVAFFFLPRQGLTPRRPVSRPLALLLYGYGARVLLSNTPQIVNVSLDQLILSAIPSVSLDELGNYAVAASVTWLVLPFSVAFGSVAFPRLAAASGEPERRRTEFLALTGALVVASIGVAALDLLAAPVVPRLFGSGFREAVPVLWLLSPGAVFLAMNRVLSDILRGRGRPFAVALGEGLGALVTVALLLLLIPTYGIRAAAVASSVAYAVVFGALWQSLRRSRRQSPNGTAPHDRWNEVA